MSDYTLRSWLWTTDHQRLGRLYLVATTIFLVIGAALGVVMRLELLTPAGDLVEVTTYEDLFTAHGLMMVHLFLLPLFPAVIGNLRGMTTAIPILNPIAWWLYVAGAVSFTTPLVFVSVFLTSLNIVVKLYRQRAWPRITLGPSAAVVLLVVGSLSAIVLPPRLASETYFAQGQVHLLAGAVLLVYLGIRGSHWIAAGFLIAFLPYLVLGYLGLPARYHDYPPEFQPWQIVSTMGALALAVALLLRGSRE